MSFFKLVFIPLYFLIGSGCQLGYLISSGYDHMAMLSGRIPIEQALESEKLNAEQKKKVKISQEARAFSFSELGLKKSDSYSHFVQLDRPYITYTVMAAYKWKFKPYLWNFPFIGKAPYKGYYNEKAAKAEAEIMRNKDFDVYVRGVSAYSTLGKLSDPLLSSMLAYKEHDLVNTVIHELVHSTLFIKDNIDFNERLAVFVAAKGTEIFYAQREGANSATLQLIKDENEDDRLFSEFITAELDQLTQWYENYTPEKSLTAAQQEDRRKQRFSEIQTNFAQKLKTKLKTKSYLRFGEGEINNARLSNYHTYMKDLNDFEKVYIKSGSKISSFLKRCELLNDVDDPEKELKKWATED